MPITETDIRDNPDVWFSRMTLFAAKGDFEQAATAKRELERLGISIKFRGRTAKRLAEAERRLSKRKQTILGGGACGD